MYNILSLGGAGFKGKMSAQFVSYMEQKAYFIARKNKCIP
jgi:hypothetical protein